jgi:hypothetical protein
MQGKEKTTLFGWEITTPHVLLVFGGLGLTGVSLYSWGNDGVKIGELILLAIASLIFGGMGGFLFGIPKIGKNKSDGQLRPNTNLEEISDWLTKIIVGLSLSQLPTINDNIVQLIESIHKDIPLLPRSVIFFLLVYFSIYGFFFSYLSTRIYLGLLFARSDERVAAAQAGIKNAIAGISDNQDHKDEDLIAKK